MARAFPLLYEVNTRCWLRDLSERSGEVVTLGNVPDSEFARWQRLGFTHVWLMGVWTTGPRSIAVALAIEDLREMHSRDADSHAIASSPYAIACYQVSPALGGEAGLQNFRNKLHSHGMKLILDFVPNHVGLDHDWLTERPELIVQSATETTGTFAQETRAGLRWLAYGRDPNFPPWNDTAQLDYRQPETRIAMTAELQAIAERCDGVRCDMAMLVLNDVFASTWAGFPIHTETAQFRSSRREEAHNEIRDPQSTIPNSQRLLTSAATREMERGFWSDAIAAVNRVHPDFLFLAEAYWGLEPRLQSLGFDYTYDKDLYDRVVRHDSRAVRDHLLRADPRFIEASAHFLENHDEPRVASLLTCAEHRAAALLILALPGMRLLHEGQLSGARVKIPIQFCGRPREDVQPAIEELYDRMLTALKATAVGRGDGSVLESRQAWPGNPTFENIILVQWQSSSPEFYLAAINLAPHRSQCYAPLTVSDSASGDWQMRDVLGSENYKQGGADLRAKGVYLDLPEHGAQLFRFRPIA